MAIVIMKLAPTLITALILAFTVAAARAGEIRVATASNFRDTMSALVNQFEQESGHEVTPIFGSTGKHFSQIMNGAPFDAFFAADSERPKRLEEENRAAIAAIEEFLGTTNGA